MLPEGWTIAKLNDLCEKILVGLAISVTPFMAPTGAKLIRNQNIKRNRFDSSSVVYIDETFANRNKTKKVREGDVVAVRTGSKIGMACLVPKEFEGALTFTTLVARPNKCLLFPQFLALHINSNRGISEVNRLMAGGGKPNLNSGELKNYRMLTPPLLEQKKIAQIISTWDKAIETVEKLIENSQQKKKALMQQLLTGKKRFLGFDGAWKEVRLGQLIKEVNKVKETSPSSYELLTVKLHCKGVVRSGKYPNATENGRPYYIRNEGELIIGRQNLHNGGIGIAGPEVNGCIASNAISSFVATENASLRYIYYAMTTHRFFTTVDNLIGGTGQKEIGVIEIKKVKLRIPELLEQERIAAVIVAADNEIARLEDHRSILFSEKKALMQQLLTGKKRVAVAA